MKRRSKELNIFSMSALDLFASALGAFILITVVLFPFFPNTGDSPERIADVRAEMSATIEVIQAELDAARSTISTLQQDLAQCQDEQTRVSGLLSEAEENLQQTFVLVVISWPSGDDVDLHVIDPRGNEYYYADRRFSGSDAALEEDNTTGPGNEIWLSPNAMPGTYEVYVNMYSKSDSSPVDVRASLLFQNGRQTLPETTLSAEGEKPLVVRFNVDEEGNVNLR